MQFSALVLSLALTVMQAAPRPMQARLLPVPTDLAMQETLVGEFVSGSGTTGTFKGTLTLTRDHAAAFAKGLLYVQVQSEKAPDGNLWGWLMAPKGRR